ncbi:DUF1819 family protein [Fictibacillus sp. WQ 8-8]|uniref:DUF1819 family protein n=1 Tax=Fictibacillus sp. WQ 8-8 TaxID=2938788 RepID=UPI00210E6B23|nr:DUF1819 family protein [Fictibacillus sp. WQ 8-8]MCQ6266320.1 DUF1819 family protein [Fictibacillus sp. WQ 8-8]
MEKKQEYKSTIKSRPFFFLETKKVADLIYQGSKAFEIKDKAIRENIFQVKTEARKKEIASIILTRLNELDDFLIGKIARGDSETSKMLVLYSILKTDRLFFEFMYEVFREKFILKEHFLTDKDFNIFFDTKKQQSDKIASWNDYTFYKIKQVYIRILNEVGLIKNQKGDREIERVYLDYEVKQHLLEIGDQTYIKIVAGE